MQLSAGAGELGGGSSASDRYPDQTAVSLYYTATGVQGPGVITGSATRATNTRLALPTDAVSTSGLLGTLTSTATSGSVKSSSTGTRASAATGSTSSSASGARETGAWLGALGVMAGGAALVAM